jgi:hypothetical protein
MADEIDWSVDDSGYDTAGSELDSYLQGGGYYANDAVADDGTTAGINSQITNQSNLFSSSDLAKLFKDSPLLQTLGAAGLGKLADKLFGVTGGPGGYKGGIPTLTASRQMLPIPTSKMNAAGTPMLDAKGVPIPRRPGSGGVTYFSPMQYLKPGETPTTPAAASIAATPTDTGIAKLLSNTPITSLPPAESVAAPTEDMSYQVYAAGGVAGLGSYSDGGRLLRGPGDGVSDSIPATIGKGQPARLADGEFVIPARIVSELGNGSTEAGARKLYAMMDRIKKARGKAKNIAADTKSDKHLPA